MGANEMGGPPAALRFETRFGGVLWLTAAAALVTISVAIAFFLCRELQGDDRLILSSLGLTAAILGGRWCWLCFKRRVFFLEFASNEIAFGWQHRPERSTRFPTSDLVAFCWDGGEGHRLYCQLRGDGKVRIPVWRFPLLSEARLSAELLERYPHIRQTSR